MYKLANISSFESLADKEQCIQENSVFNANKKNKKRLPKNSEKGYIKRKLVRDLLSAATLPFFPITNYILQEPTRTGFKDGYSRGGRWKRFGVDLLGSALGGYLGRKGGMLAALKIHPSLLSLNLGQILGGVSMRYLGEKLARYGYNKHVAKKQEQKLSELMDNGTKTGLTDSFSELRGDYEAGKLDDDQYRQLLDRMYQDNEMYHTDDYDFTDYDW